MTTITFVPCEIVEDNVTPRELRGDLKWTMPRLLELQQLWNDENWSLRRCSGHFGVTRSAISGAIGRYKGRYGLMFKAHAPLPAVKTPKLPRTPKAPRVSKMSWKLSDRPAAPSIVSDAEFFVSDGEAPESLGLTLTQLEPASCRWPTGHEGHDTFYCGHERVCRSYCAHHARQAFRR